MRSFALGLLIWGCVPPADQRDLSYSSTPRAAYPLPAEAPHIDTTEISNMRAKVKDLRADTDSMRAELDILADRLTDK